MFTHRPIERTREGDFRLRLSDAERRLLREPPAQLLALLTADPEDPSLRRLRPTAYEDDAEAEDEFRRLMDGELLESRREALLVLVDTAARDRLTAEELPTPGYGSEALRTDLLPPGWLGVTMQELDVTEGTLGNLAALD